ncbi:helix-turn-helix transcriptional regulator [Methylopila sp. M107]|uniref:helix-turn-helix transcriptional regulator n=1 Tax=Methylopila sp. M107 TaxID=1101190 RepID=UPI0003754D08|nr:helix-turn-helix transcriptional regulator [Methylopila sp. M107]
MSAPSDTGPIGLAQEAWFRLVGEVASSIGTDGFHQKLVELFGATIPHSASWIIRYSRVAPPDVIYTANVPRDVVDFYVAECAPLDPFSAHWRLNEEPGVRTLASFAPKAGAAIDPRPYSRLFKPAAEIEDELGMFFSTVGHSSLGLFLERVEGRFTAAEVRQAKLVFPVLDGFHKTHIGRIFDRLRFAGDANESELVSRPTLVRDRTGLEIFANASWRDAVAADPSIGEAVASVVDERAVQLADHTLKVERFDQYFPLAPSGTMFVLTERADAPVSAALGPELLTRKEREIFDLVMAGSTTGSIAQALSISKGMVKKYRLQIYRKTGVASERALVQKFSGLSPGVA